MPARGRAVAAVAIESAPIIEIFMAGSLRVCGCLGLDVAGACQPIQLGKADLPFTVSTQPTNPSSAPSSRQTVLPFTGLTNLMASYS
jgi:hypothetical protein